MWGSCHAAAAKMAASTTRVLHPVQSSFPLRPLARDRRVSLPKMIYRIIIAVALAANVPTECFKLVSALIVAVAIAMPQGRKLLAIQRQKLLRRKEGAKC